MRCAAGVRSAATNPTVTRSFTGERKVVALICARTAALQAPQSAHDCRGSGTLPVSSRKWIVLPSRRWQIEQRRGATAGSLTTSSSFIGADLLWDADVPSLCHVSISAPPLQEG